MKFEDRRVELLSSISIEESKVNLSHPIVFLCGGKVDVTTSDISVRNMLLEHLASSNPALFDKIKLAEYFKDWLHDAVYDNLLTFEDDIASVSSLIIIILESAGSIAELGIFSANPKLKGKLLIFIQESHFEQDSFIKLGPLRHIDPDDDGFVCSYSWDDAKIGSTLRPYLIDIERDITDFLSHTPELVHVDQASSGHIAFLIYELVSIFKALKLTEIEAYLKVLGFDKSRVEIKRLLFLLNKLEFVDSRRRGKLDYYFPISKELKVHFTNQAGGPRFDRQKMTMAAMQFYNTNDSERHRMFVISELLRKEKEQAAEQGAA
ncbi:retron St85 family effector protein [Vibrio vulnificus]|nr:retron St85 family effector protein [Vibrio vulnificus]MCU8540311.1 retron St85 family effector protein [Vibrio vulnificus]MCU8541475.1 retron St85 family effector protein [Vibrio vulnificus]